MSIIGNPLPQGLGRYDVAPVSIPHNTAFLLARIDILSALVEQLTGKHEAELTRSYAEGRSDEREVANEELAKLKAEIHEIRGML